MADPALKAFLEERERLIAMACQVVESRAVAEELVQDSWLRWHAKSYPADKAAPIFRRIVSNLALDWTRSRQTERRVLASPDLTSGTDEPSSEHIVMVRQDLKRVVAALHRLPRRTVRAFRLHFVDGLTYAEVGRRLGISLSRAHALAEDALIEITLALKD
ncbi:MAG: RNA polymerase sigma factor [Pseudomonadota bacterium]